MKLHNLLPPSLLLLLLIPTHAHPLTLPTTTIRKAFGNDIPSAWNLTRTFNDGDKLCPKNLTFTTYDGSGNTFTVRHNTILHDGARCDGDDKKSIVYYNSSLLGTDTIPAKMNEILTTVGFHVQAIDVLTKAEDGFLVGFEETGLFCGKSKFPNGTILYLVRPFKNSELMSGVGQLTTGFKYQVVVPTFSNSTCVYQTKIAGASGNSTNGTDTTSGTDSAATGNDGDKENEDNDAECFSGDGVVELENGMRKRMENVRIGDRVLTGDGKFSDVFMFTHKIQEGKFEFVEIKTASDNVLKVTKGHYLYLNGRLGAASSAKNGDVVRLANGRTSRIRSVKSVRSTGLYNPQTLDGDIVVNGVVASTYTTAVAPRFAHSLLCPLRLAYKYFDMTTSFLNKGGNGLETFAPRGAKTY